MGCPFLKPVIPLVKTVSLHCDYAAVCAATAFFFNSLHFLIANHTTPRARMIRTMANAESV